MTLVNKEKAVVTIF